ASGPGGFPDHLFLPAGYSAWLALAAGAVRPDDRPTVRRYDAFPDEGTVGAIGIVFITTAPTIVAVPRADAAAAPADLHASPPGARAHKALSGGRNRCNEQGAGCHGQ